jgi:hypothetical protein
MKNRTRLAATAIGVLAVGAIALPANASGQFASCRASGDYATCVTGGTIHAPVGTITVHTSASPNQEMFVAWDVVCSEGLSAGSRSGSYTAKAGSRNIAHPYSHPSSCIVSADAQLRQGGHSLHVWLAYSS